MLSQKKFQIEPRFMYQTKKITFYKFAASLLFIVSLFFILSSPAFAATPNTSATPAVAPTAFITPTLNVPIPDLKFSTPLQTGGSVTVNFLGEYISAIYKYLVGISVSIAIVLIMIGGFQYVLSSGSGDVGSAKKRIRNAIEGLVLLLAVYVILYTVNPQMTILGPINIKNISEIPLENMVTYGEGVTCTDSGTDLSGVNSYQDCMLKNYGATEEEVRDKLVEVEYNGPTQRTYKVHELMAEDFKKAILEIESLGDTYDIGRSLAGGTFNWRCNRNSAKALSAHSWGTAIDVNPDTNPNCPSSCLKSGEECKCIGGDNCVEICRTRGYDLPKLVIDAFEKNNFVWGGTYKRVQDYMHFTYDAVCKGG